MDDTDRPATHPARIIKDDLKPEFHPAADYLLGHEDEHGVRFVPISVDLFDTLVLGYEDALKGASYDPGETAGSWVQKVGQALGLED